MKNIYLLFFLSFIGFYSAKAQNVGIGTAVPESKLSVKGGMSVGSSYSENNAAPANGLIIEGNVGIGIPSPSEALDIDGFIKLNSGNDPTSINEFSTDGTLGDNSDNALPTEKAVKSYIDSKTGETVSASTSIAQLTTNWDTDINQSSELAIQWDGQDIMDEGYSHSTSTNSSRLTVNEAGVYRIYVSLSFNSSSARTNPRIRIKKNGSTYLTGAGLGGYIRAASGHNEASSNFTVLAQLNSNDYLEVVSEQISSSGAVTLRDGESVFSVQRIDITNAPKVVQLTDASGGADLNPSGVVPFDNEIKKDNIYLHSNSSNNSRVEIDQTGWYRVNYTVTYNNNDGNNDRVTMRSRVRKNGATFIEGSGSRTYLRDYGYGEYSSTQASLVTQLQEGDYIEIYADKTSGSSNGTFTVADETQILVEQLHGGAPAQGFQNPATEDLNMNGFDIIGANMDWNQLNNIPADIADGDDNTTYSAGNDLNLSGTTFSLEDDIDITDIRAASGGKVQVHDLLDVNDNHIEEAYSVKFSNKEFDNTYFSEDASDYGRLAWDRSEGFKYFNDYPSADHWATIWDSDNDGSGSGMDADRLDGQQGTYYLDWNNLNNVPSGLGNGDQYLPDNPATSDVNMNGNNIDMNGQGYITFDNDNEYYLGGGSTKDANSSGIHLEAQSNPGSGDPLFVVESSGSAERLRVEHDGALKTYNHLEVDANTGGDSYIDGDLAVNATSMSGSYNLYVNGRIGTNGINETSDRRYKTNIKTVDRALEKVNQLRGVYYDWRQDEFPEKEFEDGRQLGVIAQEIEVVLPEVVHTDDNGYKSVEYGHLAPVLIEALNELTEKVKAQEAELQALRSQKETVETLKAENQSLKADVAEIKQLLQMEAQK